jgi:hypothetical protein
MVLHAWCHEQTNAPLSIGKGALIELCDGQLFVLADHNFCRFNNYHDRIALFEAQ